MQDSTLKQVKLVRVQEVPHSNPVPRFGYTHSRFSVVHLVLPKKYRDITSN